MLERLCLDLTGKCAKANRELNCLNTDDAALAREPVEVPGFSRVAQRQAKIGSNSRTSRPRSANLFSPQSWQPVCRVITGRNPERAKAVKYPGFSRDIVSFGLVKEISIATARERHDAIDLAESEAASRSKPKASAS